ncbi:MAG: hypothetical protein IT531_03795 [Burkholderiales bacterium]|nr:hypothetical protein [Burkholderiales bacterium]
MSTASASAESRPGTAGERAPAGWRARLGVVVPSVNTVVEPWFGSTAPAGVSVHAARMLLDNALSAEAIVRMDREEGEHALRQLASCRPHAIAYCCTASSIVQGLAYDIKLQREMSDHAGVPCTTATQAILQAMHVLGVSNVAAASPYGERIDGAEHAFFEAAGIRIASSACLGIEDAFELARPSADEIIALAKRAHTPAVDAVLITCLNLWSHLVIEALEQAFGVPVITSTQATFWRLLRLAGIDDRIGGFGRLLAEH